jgi:hypothetical protein
VILAAPLGLELSLRRQNELLPKINIRLRMAPSSKPPPPRCDHRPDCLDQPEGPRALEESVYRSQNAGKRKAQDKPGAAFLERITQHHRGDGEQSECGKRIHVVFSVLMSELLNLGLAAKKEARKVSGLVRKILSDPTAG